MQVPLGIVCVMMSLELSLVIKSSSGSPVIKSSSGSPVMREVRVENLQNGNLCPAFW